MIIEIQFDSEVPIYEQLRRQIILGIAKGELKKGEELPSVRRLGEELGINLHTVRKAYNILKDEGYLSIDRRVGAVVKGDFRLGEDFKFKFERELEFLLAEAFNRGITRQEFLNLSEEIYKRFEEES